MGKKNFVLSPFLRQFVLYLLFAAAMILLNILIQDVHSRWIVPFIADHFGDVVIFSRFYLSVEPYNMPELIGSVLAVGITYIIKFVLDKLIVFQETFSGTKDTRRQFLIYLGLAVITTVENIGIQFILGILTPWTLSLRIIIALVCGYLTKFFLDRKFCFIDTTETETPVVHESPKNKIAQNKERKKISK
jgi:putative flippase GtrA